MAAAKWMTGITAAVWIAAASAATAEEPGMYKGYETAPYRVLRQDGPVELRAYDPYLVAEVRVSGPRQQAVGRGFRTLASYIFGDNAASQKIAMTAPVAQVALTPEPGAETGQVWDVQFMMPAGSHPAALPVPDSAAIRFEEIAPRNEAVLRFSGFWTDRKLEAKAEELRAWIAAQGLTVTGGPRFYYYDDPFTLPFNRRNEVAFTLAAAG